MAQQRGMKRAVKVLSRKKKIRKRQAEAAMRKEERFLELGHDHDHKHDHDHDHAHDHDHSHDKSESK